MLYGSVETTEKERRGDPGFFRQRTLADGAVIRARPAEAVAVEVIGSCVGYYERDLGRNTYKVDKLSRSRCSPQTATPRLEDIHQPDQSESQHDVLEIKSYRPRGWQSLRWRHRGRGLRKRKRDYKRRCQYKTCGAVLCTGEKEHEDG